MIFGRDFGNFGKCVALGNFGISEFRKIREKQNWENVVFRCFCVFVLGLFFVWGWFSCILL